MAIQQSQERRNKNAPRIPLFIGPETFSKEEVVGTN